MTKLFEEALAYLNEDNTEYAIDVLEDIEAEILEETELSERAKEVLEIVRDTLRELRLTGRAEIARKYILIAGDVWTQPEVDGYVFDNGKLKAATNELIKAARAFGNHEQLSATKKLEVEMRFKRAQRGLDEAIAEEHKLRFGRNSSL